ncbi:MULTISPECIES: cobalt-precorrin 5A hydrolase [Aerococcus]|uniref:cobalt-precorrin 5A hydrolase n=1 Tax=Aerococcus urinae (strain CCUG 59500 / ACS-120-V-Col10a) TaxID=2976812 RepID=UPI00227C3107|nr:cobalt-precorrin 5A hydrolase [Aerococcus sp. Group 1]MCY3030025.1 cobalt-precorrin 5A hydrolase [Aerococcus sp. Group 1]MCY3054768.1 cobalt-precorrin 5A hydrolase [Aerococcus sp. Group 1]MCY3056498.1 cobalt-precorrin 5A hydrolase [Aerococcus sp. Group 1]MCY3061177.1 cobalt-precorrin 5A hydrolase [Aerococcus sp. Group 1]
MALETKVDPRFLERMQRGEENKRVAIITITQKARDLGRKIKANCFPQARLYVRMTDQAPLDPRYHECKQSQGRAVLALQEAFQSADLVIAIMATGVVVRALAPVIEDKMTDPAVLVLDEGGQHVISLLAGHFGRANHYARLLAKELPSQAVITTATDSQGRLGIDDLAFSYGAVYSDFKKQTRRFNLLIAEGAPILYLNGTVFNFTSPPGYQTLAKGNCSEPAAKTSSLDPTTWAAYQGLVLVTNRQQNYLSLPKDLPLVEMIPRRYILGIGCKKNTPYPLLLEELEKFLQGENLRWESIKTVVSIDLKAEEEAILQLAKDHYFNFKTFSKEDLLAFESYYPGSDFVKKTVGVSSVSQTAAHLESKGHVVSGRYAHNGVTFTLAYYQEEE